MINHDIMNGDIQMIIWEIDTLKKIAKKIAFINEKIKEHQIVFPPTNASTQGIKNCNRQIQDLLVLRDATNERIDFITFSLKLNNINEINRFNELMRIRSKL